MRNNEIYLNNSWHKGGAPRGHLIDDMNKRNINEISYRNSKAIN